MRPLQALQRLTEAAEKAKIELSNLSSTSISLPFITATADGPKHIDSTLSRAKFEQLCSDLLDRWGLADCLLAWSRSVPLNDTVTLNAVMVVKWALDWPHASASCAPAAASCHLTVI